MSVRALENEENVMVDQVAKRWTVWCEHTDGRRYRMGDSSLTRWSQDTAERVAKHMTAYEVGTFAAQPFIPSLPSRPDDPRLWVLLPEDPSDYQYDGEPLIACLSRESAEARRDEGEREPTTYVPTERMLRVRCIVNEVRRKWLSDEGKAALALIEQVLDGD